VLYPRSIESGGQDVSKRLFAQHSTDGRVLSRLLKREPRH
jgi:hypothetical protein